MAKQKKHTPRTLKKHVSKDGLVKQLKVQEAYQKKSALLKAQLDNDSVCMELQKSAIENGTECVVFLSVCNTKERASVFTGTGKTLEAAFAKANTQALTAVNQGLETVWMKMDVVHTSQTVSTTALQKMLKESRQEFFRYGIAFDEKYDTALLEAELNGHKIYDYKEHGINLQYLNTYLKRAGRTPLNELPETYQLFSCYGWVCDETQVVHTLYHDGLHYGRRELACIDNHYVEQILGTATQFLVQQVKKDGSFIYGMYPRFDNHINGYNIMRHTSTLWSLLCRYQMQPSWELKRIIDMAFEYVLRFIRFADKETAFLYEETADELKLGANGVAIIAMTEYMKVFNNQKYTELCKLLGNGILMLLDQTTGTYYHVLDGDFLPKEKYRTVYYDGEATFALCRLYTLTNDKKWLDAAVSAVNHFIEADYTKHRDHWVAYAMNEITKHITDNQDYYKFALRNVQVNLKQIHDRDTTYHTFLEMLMVAFETYHRMLEHGITPESL